jgi:DNA-binding response OmpR family regulator
MKTALLVERDPCVRSAVCDVITPGGVRIVCARDCAEGIRCLSEEGMRPRVIVLDLPRAGGEGLRFLTWLRATAFFATTPVVLLVNEPDSEWARDLVVLYGALGAMSAGLEEWRLVQAVDRLCAGPRKKRALTRR